MDAMLDHDRRCGNCVRISPSGHCRHLGPLGGAEVRACGIPCAWHRADGEAALLPPRQLLEEGESMHRMLRCNFPRDRAERAGWTHEAAHDNGRRVITPPKHMPKALTYTRD